MPWFLRLPAANDTKRAEESEDSVTVASPIAI